MIVNKNKKVVKILNLLKLFLLFGSEATSPQKKAPGGRSWV